MTKPKEKSSKCENSTRKKYNLRKDNNRDNFEAAATTNMATKQDTEKGNGHASDYVPSSTGPVSGQSDVSSAGQPGVKSITPDNDLKCAIKQQITEAMSSPEVIDIITEAVYDAIEQRLEEKVTTKVYDAINMDLEKKCSEIKKLENEMKSLKVSINAMENAKDDAEQYSRRNCLIMHGVSESPSENTDQKVIDIINQNLGIRIAPEAIDRSHRIYRRPSNHGNPTPLDSNAVQRSNPRAIVVKFTRYNDRQAVYKARTKLRYAQGMKVFIHESLTSKRIQLYRETLQNNNVNSIWSQDGKIFAFTKENKRVHINSRHDIDKL